MPKWGSVTVALVALVAVAGSSASLKPKPPAPKGPQVAVLINGGGWVTWKNGKCEGHPGKRFTAADACGLRGKPGTKVKVFAKDPPHGWSFRTWGGVCSGTPSDGHTQRRWCWVSIKRKLTSVVANFRLTSHGTSTGGG
jgi:hypothetical protein